MTKKHLVIPDVQFKPGNDTKFLEAIGNYIVEKRPDVVVNLGDFADMPSLSSYDVGTKSFEGRRYKDDIAASVQAMEALLHPLKACNERAKSTIERDSIPGLCLLLGTMNTESLRQRILTPSSTEQ